MQPLISTVSHNGDFCFLGVFAQASRAEQLLEAGAVLPGDGTATEVGVGSARAALQGMLVPKRAEPAPLVLSHVSGRSSEGT